MKINVAMVSYKNTKPFLFGFNQHIENSPFKLSLLNPSKCSQAFEDGNADIALVPVAFLEDRNDYKIITDFCIGADGPVNSVALFSNKPIEKIEKLILDNHSITSNRLVKILLEHYWKKELEFVKRDVSQGVKIEEDEAVIMIGDKVFDYQNQFEYKYDLAEVWKEMTGKPFVFAVWIAKKSISKELEHLLNEILKFGIDNIEEILNSESDAKVDLREYLTINLKYKLTTDYKEALNSFLSDFKVPQRVV